MEEETLTEDQDQEEANRGDTPIQNENPIHQKILSFLQKVYYLCGSDWMVFNMNDIQKKHGVNPNVRLMMMQHKVVLSKGSSRYRQYKWNEDMGRPSMAVAMRLYNLAREYHSKASKKYSERKKQMRAKYKKEQKGKDDKKGKVGRPKGAASSNGKVMKRVSLQEYIDNDFELLGCYVELGRADKALAKIEDIKSNISILLKKR